MDSTNWGDRPMRDTLGWRALLGVLGPSTNTVVQPDFDDMRPAGVTNHYSRILTPDAHAVSNETFLDATNVIAANVTEAVDSVMTCAPDYLVMGMSAITFYGGMEGADSFQSKLENHSGLGVSIGSHATAAALRAIGGVKRIAFLSPYFPAANDQVSRYFTDAGFEVVADRCLLCPRWTAIAQVGLDRMRGEMESLRTNGVDALVQVGTNLPMARLASELEAEWDLPVVAINTATYWHALRSLEISDQFEGFGRLLRHF